MDTVKIDDVLRLQDFGLERLDEDEAILRFAQRRRGANRPLAGLRQRSALDAHGAGRSGVRLFVHI